MSNEKKQCECWNWARSDEAMFLTEHHPRCDRYDPEGDALELIKELTQGIEEWAYDCDGVHPLLWEAYVRAKFAIGEGGEVNLDSEAI